MNARLSGRIRIVRSSPAQAERLSEIARASKAHWGYDAAFMARVAHMLRVSQAYVADWPVYEARRGRQIVGFYGLRDVDGALHMNDLWVLPQHLGVGIGKRLWEHAVRQARRLGHSSFLIASDPNAEGFYIHMGARRIGEIDGGAGRAIPLLRYGLSAVGRRKARRAGASSRRGRSSTSRTASG